MVPNHRQLFEQNLYQTKRKSDEGWFNKHKCRVLPFMLPIESTPSFNSLPVTGPERQLYLSHRASPVSLVN